MTNEEAMHAIDNIMAQIPEGSPAAEALFKAKIELSQKIKYPFIQCKIYGYWFQKIAVKENYDAHFDIHDYYIQCHHCGYEQEWNDCYWR